jgi:hypothetical protein
MLLGGMQFLSNPATTLPLVIGTYKLGALVLDVTGVSAVTEPPVTAPDLDLSQSLPLPTDETTATAGPSASSAADPAAKSWADRLYAIFAEQLPPRGQPMTVQDWIRLLAYLFGALLIGALIAGLALGAALDLLWRNLVVPAAQLRASRKPITATVTPHDNPPPAP